MKTENYFGKFPSNQNAVDLFAGQWFSTLPEKTGADTGGVGKLYDDERIHWTSSQLGGLEGKNVLELGPLEGCHSAMVELAGAASVLAIEANANAYLRCLLVKELLGLQKTRYLLGDFLEYLRAAPGVFDVGLACGVIYHMKNPVELIELLSKRVRSLFVWTHFWDGPAIDANPVIRNKFSGSWEATQSGFSHKLHAYNYGDALDWAGFCGGGSESCNWMEKSELLDAFEHFGFRLEGERLELDHPNGPAIWLSLTNPRL